MEVSNKKVGIVICNYNKSEYVKNCVASILNQSFLDRDVYVVDNASTDDSVQVLSVCYGNRIAILQNEENIGGAGGFDRGIEYCMERGYSYILLVDNDTCFDVNALEVMYEYLESNSDVGMCGAGILQMSNPEYIQEIGGMIDYKRYEISANYRNKKLSEEIPETIECDFLAACALLVKREVIENVGSMRRDYFVYWDDIEWCRRCKDAGYRLVALRDAHVWHNWSASTVTKFNAFAEYYGRRNKLRFFATYIDEGDIDSFVESALQGMFNILYGHYRKEAFAEMQMTIYALDDIIHNVWGKASAIKTTVNKITELPLEKLLKNEKEVYLIPNAKMKEDGGLSAIEKVIRFCNSDIKIMKCIEPPISRKDTICIKPCSHVTCVKESILPVVYVDRFFNGIITEEDLKYFQSHEKVYGLFYRLYEPLLKEGVRKIREK